MVRAVCANREQGPQVTVQKRACTSPHHWQEHPSSPRLMPFPFSTHYVSILVPSHALTDWLLLHCGSPGAPPPLLRWAIGACPFALPFLALPCFGLQRRSRT